jgi:hypothetical protein
MSSTSSMETSGIRATLILEVIGRPPEHLTATLENMIKKIGDEDGVTIENQKINKPVLMKDHKDFYTTFAELEVVVENISILNVLMFKYMPAHMEIISPELIALSNNGWNDIFNETLRKLHGYDEVTRVLQVKHIKMQKRLNELEGTAGGESASEEKVDENSLTE